MQRTTAGIWRQNARNSKRSLKSINRTENDDADTSSDNDTWKAELGKNLPENYGVTPDHYEDMGDGVYQIYAVIDGKIISCVTLNPATDVLLDGKETTVYLKASDTEIIF